MKKSCIGPIKSNWELFHPKSYLDITWFIRSSNSVYEDGTPNHENDTIHIKGNDCVVFFDDQEKYESVKEIIVYRLNNYLHCYKEEWNSFMGVALFGFSLFDYTQLVCSLLRDFGSHHIKETNTYGGDIIVIPQ